MSDPVDWSMVEREYRLGQLRLGEISTLAGVSEATVRRRAKADGWTRNGAGEAPDRIAAIRGLEVAQLHRHMLADLRETLGAVQQSLRDHLAAPAAEEGGPFGARAETVAGLVSALGTTAERLIRLERQAFGLTHQQDGSGDGDGDADGIRRRLEGRLARLALAGPADGIPGEPQPG